MHFPRLYVPDKPSIFSKKRGGYENIKLTQNPKRTYPSQKKSSSRMKSTNCTTHINLCHRLDRPVHI